jgi:hypothetical protein
MYGVVLGFNLILALLPIINTLDIVTPQMMQRSFLKVLPSQFTVPFINAILQLLFLLVGINMIFYVGKIIYVVVFDVSTKDKEKVKSMDEEGEAVLGGVTGLINGAKNVVNGSALMEAVKGIAGYVPGSEIVSDVKKKWHNHQESSQVHQDARDSRRDARTRL